MIFTVLSLEDKEHLGFLLTLHFMARECLNDDQDKPFSFDQPHIHIGVQHRLGSNRRKTQS
jgi:hypothetical protein